MNVMRGINCISVSIQSIGYDIPGAKKKEKIFFEKSLRCTSMNQFYLRISSAFSYIIIIFNEIRGNIFLCVNKLIIFKVVGEILWYQLLKFECLNLTNQ